MNACRDEQIISVGYDGWKQMSQLQSDEEKCIYLSISHCRFIVGTPRFIVPFERMCEDNEQLIVASCTPISCSSLRTLTPAYLMVLP